ncbi:MAG TPA: hydroxysqualene dehydroxylase HpnE [Burkholderiales bacterium]|nr:hydroxysqualene dehydroxylase HpnE [Burkholderiales bacterium]
MHAARRIAVVGGGWAGMAAAVELAARGMQVAVFEAGKLLGGRARRVEVDGAIFDNGLHILVGAYRETLRLIAMVRQPGGTDGLLRLPIQLRVEPGFALSAPRLPAPLHLAVALATASGLSLSGRIAAIRFMLAQRLRRFRCDPSLTVSELLARHAQPQPLIDFLWGPLCIAALNTLPREASAQVFLAVLRDSLASTRAASDLLLPTVDFSALFPEPARRFVEERGGSVQTAAPVKAVHLRGNDFEIESPQGGTFSDVVLATDPHRACELLEPLPATAALIARLRKFAYRPIYSIYLQYPDGVRLPGPMVGFRDGIAQWAFDRGQLCNQPGLIAVVISASGAHQQLPHQELAHAVHTELAQWLPGLPVPLRHQVIAEKRATFACVPQLDRPGNRTPLPRLYLAGDYTDSEYPATLEAAVRSGVACARLIARNG